MGYWPAMLNGASLWSQSEAPRKQTLTTAWSETCLRLGLNFSALSDFTLPLSLIRLYPPSVDKYMVIGDGWLISDIPHPSSKLRHFPFKEAR